MATAETKMGVLLIEQFKTTKLWPPGSTSVGHFSYESGSVGISHSRQPKHIQKKQDDLHEGLFY
jgi:hypothetical protein